MDEKASQFHFIWIELKCPDDSNVVQGGYNGSTMDTAHNALNNEIERSIVSHTIHMDHVTWYT